MAASKTTDEIRDLIKNNSKIVFFLNKHILDYDWYYIANYVSSSYNLRTSDTYDDYSISIDFSKFNQENDSLTDYGNMMWEASTTDIYLYCNTDISNDWRIVDRGASNVLVIDFNVESNSASSYTLKHASKSSDMAYLQFRQGGLVYCRVNLLTSVEDWETGEVSYRVEPICLAPLNFVLDQANEYGLGGVLEEFYCSIPYNSFGGYPDGYFTIQQDHYERGINGWDLWYSTGETQQEI